MLAKFNCVFLSLPEALFLLKQYWSKPLSNCVFCVTDHCAHNRHPKDIGSREKYLEPKHFSTVLVHGFVFSHLLVPKIWRHKGDIFLQCVLGSLESLRHVRGKLIIICKQKVHFWIDLHSSAPGASLCWLWWAGVCWLLLEFTLTQIAEEALVIPTTSTAF